MNELLNKKLVFNVFERQELDYFTQALSHLSNAAVLLNATSYDVEALMDLIDDCYYYYHNLRDSSVKNLS